MNNIYLEFFQRLFVQQILTDHVPCADTVLSTLKTLSHSNITRIRGKYCYFLYFIDKETNHTVYNSVQAHTANWVWTWYSNRFSGSKNRSTD